MTDDAIDIVYPPSPPLVDGWREREQLGDMVEYRRAGDIAEGELEQESWGDRIIVRKSDGWTWTHYENGISTGSHPIYYPGRQQQQKKELSPPPALFQRWWIWLKRGYPSTREESVNDGNDSTERSTASGAV